jgi:hypothetical protein
MISLVPHNLTLPWRRNSSASVERQDVAPLSDVTMGVTHLNSRESAQFLDLVSTPAGPTQEFLNSSNDFDRLFG